MSYVINCRARVHPECYDGQRSELQFGENLPLSEDGTYKEGTIICDACYCRLMPLTASGRGLTHELEDAIERYRRTERLLDR
jgi:hypothetical protein